MIAEPALGAPPFSHSSFCLSASYSVHPCTTGQQITGVAQRKGLWRCGRKERPETRRGERDGLSDMTGHCLCCNAPLSLAVCIRLFIPLRVDTAPITLPEAMSTMSAEKKLAAIDDDDAIAEPGVSDAEKEKLETSETSKTTRKEAADAGEVKSCSEKVKKEDEEERKEATKVKEEEMESKAGAEAEAKDTTTETEAPPPPMPTRPAKRLSQTDLTIAQLVDVFPHLDLKYIKMALIASEGRLEPASNALLFLSDPSSGIEIPQPHGEASLSVPSAAAGNIPSLEESDEALARRLARAYERGSRRTSASTANKGRTRPQEHGSDGNRVRRTPSMNEHRVYNNFIDDDDDNNNYGAEEDLYETITKNVNDAKQVVGGWFGNVAKKLQESMDQSPDGQTQAQRQGRQAPPFPNRRQSPVPQHGSEPYSRSPYQQPQSIQRGYYSQKNEYVVSAGEEDNDDDAPKLPARGKGQAHLYPAVGGGHSDIEAPVQIEMTDASTDLADSPKPIEKDDMYTTNSAKITMNKKSEPTTATSATTTITAANAKSAAATPASSKSKTWTPLKSVDPEPSSDAFLVDDSEDDDDK